MLNLNLSTLYLYCVSFHVKILIKKIQNREVLYVISQYIYIISTFFYIVLSIYLYYLNTSIFSYTLFVLLLKLSNLFQNFIEISYTKYYFLYFFNYNYFLLISFFS